MFWLLFSCASIDSTLTGGGKDDCESAVWYQDADGDGWGGENALAECEPPSGYVAETGDCDDESEAIFPGAEEACNSLDDDCDGEVDEGAAGATTWYLDSDGDGYGDPDSPVIACEAPSNAVSDSTDCDDALNTVFPGADETCNEVDDDCDTEVDEDPVDAPTWYTDSDGDGWGVSEPTLEACDMPSGYADNADDCDDSNAALTGDCGEPSVNTGDCGGGQVWSYVDPAATAPELHIVGVYNAHQNASGNVVVNVNRQTQMTLVLSAYDPTSWTVNVASGVQIDTILVNGYHSQTVSAPSSIPVETRSYDQTGTNFGNYCGYSLPYAGGGCDTNILISGVENYVGQSMTSFTGCYSGIEFTVE
ncbi:MAG: putative metal-binding motif-containing protein [Myxococcota bacterium]|nr:putative metal-binding motif-containing protein [Myxococcota bacterium]